jgi:predicted ATPase/tetratricopeptide (TPR) repeat protein
VDGEVQLPVAPLAVPTDDVPPARVAGFAASQLFLDRALAVVPDLSVNDDVLSAVGLVCRRLDGIPLALELAAARLPALGPAELADRLQDRFAVLSFGSRTAQARQRTLKATVDWSHDLMTAAERALFRRLSVFRGSWDLAAVEAITVGDLVRSGAVLDLLERLVRQSMVLADHGSASTRYRMLETLREYGELELGRTGETDFFDRHARYFVQLAERAELGLRGSTQAEWVGILDANHANIRAALSWLTRTGGQANVDLALRLCGSLGLYWHMGRHLEGRATLRQVLAQPGPSEVPRARALQAMSLVERPRACLVHPSEQCAAAAGESLRIFETVGDRHRAAFSKLLLSVEGVRGVTSVDAPALLDAADQEFAGLGDDWGQAVAAFVRMETLTKRGHETDSREVAATAIERFRRLGDGWGLSAVLYHAGWALTQFGRHGEAVPVLQEAIAVATDAGVHNTAQWALADLGIALLALGRLEQAADCFVRAGADETTGHEAGAALATYGQAVLAQTRGDYSTAAPLFAKSKDAFAKMGVRLAMGRALSGLADCHYRSGDPIMSAREYAEMVELGESCGESGLVAAGLEGLARIAASGNPREGARLLGRAARLRATQARPPTPPELAVTLQAEEAARHALGDADYQSEVERGAMVAAGRA